MRGYLEGLARERVIHVSLFRVDGCSHEYLYAFPGLVGAEEIRGRFGDGSYVLKVYQRDAVRFIEAIRVILGVPTPIVTTRRSPIPPPRIGERCSECGQLVRERPSLVRTFVGCMC